MLTITSRDLTRDARRIMHDAGIPATAAATAALASCTVAKSVSGARAAFVDTGLIAGGAIMAAKGKGKVVPYAGVGIVFGVVWGILSKK
jgi:hypothetical protein